MAASAPQCWPRLPTRMRGTCLGSREHSSQQPRGRRIPIFERRDALGREGQLAGIYPGTVPPGLGTSLASRGEKGIGKSVADGWPGSFPHSPTDL